MNFEYNGNLLEEKRINLVAKEITGFYPEISIDKAKYIASLEEKISTEVTLDIIFNRMYNILLVVQDSFSESIKVYKDLVKLVLSNKNNEKFDYYYDILQELSKFLCGKREFPLLSEFVY